MHSKTLNYIPTRAMLTLWRWYDHTGFLPFGWVGNLLGDCFVHNLLDVVTDPHQWRIASLRELQNLVTNEEEDHANRTRTGA